MNPAISVVIPTRNRPALLGEALYSIAIQQGVDRTDIEVVVVNDGGMTSRRQCRPPTTTAWLSAASRSRSARAFRWRATRGIEHALGDCLAFVDDDDVFLPHHLRKALDALDSGTDLLHTVCMVSPRRVDPASPVSAPLSFDIPFDDGLLSFDITDPFRHAPVIWSKLGTAVDFPSALATTSSTPDTLPLQIARLTMNDRSRCSLSTRSPSPRVARSRAGYAHARSMWRETDDR